jgi:hypothetical protein
MLENLIVNWINGTLVYPITIWTSIIGGIFILAILAWGVNEDLSGRKVSTNIWAIEKYHLDLKYLATLLQPGTPKSLYQAGLNPKLVGEKLFWYGPGAVVIEGTEIHKQWFLRRRKEAEEHRIWKDAEARRSEQAIAQLKYTAHRNTRLVLTNG